MTGTLTETRYIRHDLSDKELLDLSRQMTNAISRISEKTDQLKSTTSAIRAEIAEQEAVLNKCVEKLKVGYEMRPHECTVTYDKTTVKYADKETGEVIDEHPMTEDEQLRLTGVRIDAEQIIRQAREEEE